MESELYKLLTLKTIPYISKKHLNDELRNKVLRQLSFEFYQHIYDITTHQLQQFCIMKGGAAIAVHLNDINAKISDLDLEIYIDDANFNPQHSIQFRRLENTLKSFAFNSYANVNEALSSIEFASLLPEEVENNIDNNDTITIFKSYVNEALQVPDKGRNMKFELNKEKPFNTTISMVNNEYYLVRYSFNVNMKCHDSSCSLILYKDNTMKKYLQSFSFDLYFIDLSIKQKPSCDAVNHFIMKKFLNRLIFVENIQYVIADQIECILFNVFYKQHDKVLFRMNRLSQLLHYYNTNYYTKSQLQYYKTIKYHDKTVYSMPDLKTFMYRSTPKLGFLLAVYLYHSERFTINIKDVTHQINFPYHKLNDKYFNKSFTTFINIGRELFKI
ncbi:hypothetical protein ManeNPV_00115 [Malacosoma neustria nucleopolyhedrovirus]|uniref:hypothetical protein n=1 Tax=Malacosoma neustria nuclear polyhedrosis virus TaxID=38012 RepID=UPI000E358C8D|nr:hypothetical protein ManeNPV_00115 [Malacosoma neustria nucleopolyhedrovirus]AUF81641.1 hypothetical protein ManeNPV_00115 [Malacosoma neustria nucleopolyhedrovirus]